MNSPCELPDTTIHQGSRLPSVRDIAADACANPNTVQRALSGAERSGLVRTERTNGRFVTEDERALKEIYKWGYLVRILMNSSRSCVILG